ncbi:uncharacterized protein LOC123632073 [Lemur catta]|uniref:uncharacterized protein LOC123632073 n=1 Tax=Lemur catta TaxID=9447 RepID=UPI001E26E6B9|nr:uncharacterized protein LOC123632073 [Lemur catta]
MEEEDRSFKLCVPGIVTLQSPLHKTFGSTDAVGCMESELKKLLAVQGESCFWRTGSREGRELLTQPEITLDGASVVDGQVCLPQGLQEVGPWPLAPAPLPGWGRHSPLLVVTSVSSGPWPPVCVHTHSSPFTISFCFSLDSESQCPFLSLNSAIHLLCGFGDTKLRGKEAAPQHLGNAGDLAEGRSVPDFPPSPSSQALLQPPEEDPGILQQEVPAQPAQG